MTPSRIPVEIKVIDPRLVTEFGGLPRPATAGAAAADVVACALLPKTAEGKPDPGSRRPLTEALALAPGETAFVGLGFAMDIGDPNHAAFLIPRSGMGAALGIVMGNLTGLIDSDYHGELVACLWNRNPQGGPAVRIRPGERVAQIYIGPVVRAEWTVVDEFSRATGRGAGGFGSTGSGATGSGAR